MFNNGWWLSNYWEASPALAISWVFWVIFSICLHELAHGFVAIRLGDDTPIQTGHMTWNPLVHMGTQALIMFAIFGFTWGLMPINPHRLRGRYGESWVAFAGPLCNLLQFAFVMTGLVGWDRFGGGVEPQLHHNIWIFLRVGAVINLGGACFNLIPVPPLDGSRIVGDIFPSYWELLRGRGAVLGVIAYGLLFFVGGKYVWDFAFDLVSHIEHAAVRVLWGI